MKRSVIAVLMLMLMATVANASVIGLFADMDATVCAVDVPVYAPAPTIYVLAILDDAPAITAAEFGIENLPMNIGYPSGQVTLVWNTSLVIGDPYAGVALAFTEPLVGPICLLGTIDILAFAPDYVGLDEMLCVVPSPESGVLAIVDEAFATIPADGWCFVLNCQVGGPNGNCDCFDSIPTEDTNWGSVKALY